MGKHQIVVRLLNSSTNLPICAFRYQCQHIWKLYDVAITDDDGNIKLVDLEEGSGKEFDPDPYEQAITGEYGICVDVDSSMNQGCPDKTMSAVMDGVVGCMDRRVSAFLCGLELDIADGDSSTASIKGNFLYMPPRVLVEGGDDLDGDGKSTPAITCTDPIDCVSVCTFNRITRHKTHGCRRDPSPLTIYTLVSNGRRLVNCLCASQKCRYLERTSLNGAGAPPTCAL